MSKNHPKSGWNHPKSGSFSPKRVVAKMDVFVGDSFPRMQKKSNQIESTTTPPGREVSLAPYSARRCENRVSIDVMNSSSTACPCSSVTRRARWNAAPTSSGSVMRSAYAPSARPMSAY